MVCVVPDVEHQAQMILYIVKDVKNQNYPQGVGKDMIDEAGGSLPTEEEVAEFSDEASNQLE